MAEGMTEREWRSDYEIGKHDGIREGLRRAEEIAEKLFADSGYHPYTREGAERAALAIRAEREKLEKGQ